MATDEPTTLGRVVRELREVVGLSQYSLALKAGISQQTLAEMETDGRSTGFETVRKLARALGVTVHHIDQRLPEPELGDPDAGTRGRGRPKQRGK